MKKMCLSFLLWMMLMAASGATSRVHSAPAWSYWKRVNDPAFGMDSSGTPGYQSEDGFEVQVFKGQLYAGMEADNQWGARLWRTRPGILRAEGQSDWEEVIADDQDRPFGITNTAQVDHIDSLQEFKGYLYASLANRSGYPSGIRLFRSSSGQRGTWQDVLDRSGFGDPANENFKDMIVFHNQLCGGTGNSQVGAQVWCSPDGLNWNQVNQDGFGNPQNYLITSSGIYSDALYLGVASTNSGGVWRSPDLLNWMPVFTASGYTRVEILDSVAGQFYIAAGAGGGLSLTDPPVHLYRSRSGDPGSWSETGQEVAAASEHNLRSVADGAMLFKGGLYVSFMNPDTGFQLWRTYGEGWTYLTSSLDSSGSDDNFAAQMIPFNGYLYSWTSNYLTGQQMWRSNYPLARYVIVMIGDGMGAQQIAATRSYTGQALPFESADWLQTWVSTYAAGGSYDSQLAWTDLAYLKSRPTDSAAAATALFTGSKTANGRISATASGSRLFSLGDKTRLLGRGLGTVTSVYLSHATPGAWMAHNLNRNNGYAIADEGLWGQPDTTGDPGLHPAYAGGLGSTLPPVEVAIGAGHPNWSSSTDGNRYITQTMLTRLRQDDSYSQVFQFVERQAGRPDGGARLLAGAGAAATCRLVGLFGGANGHLEYRRANGQGANPENPTLAEMTRAALQVLQHHPQGFSLMVEGGAIDSGAHANQLDLVIGEVWDLAEAVQAVIDWVDSPTTPATWENTLVVVTADHETGLLTAAPQAFPDQPSGPVNDASLALERPQADTLLRASWEDDNQNNLIDSGETVYWAWNSQGHSNSLVPLAARGVGADLLTSGTAFDSRRGVYLDNTQIFLALDLVTFNEFETLTSPQIRLPLLIRP